MDETRKSNVLRPAIGLMVVALGALALAMAWWPGSTQPASAGGTAGLDLSIGVGSSCDSTAVPAKCAVDVGATFTVAYKVNAIPAGFAYGAYGMDIMYSGNVSVVTGTLVQTGAGVWPSCVFAVAEAGFTPGDALTGCTIGPGAPDSTYVGTLATLNFQCGASEGAGTLTLAMGPGKTEVLDSSLIGHSDAADETLTINCGAEPPTPAATPTPCDGPCPTATPTNTVPPPPTATPTRTPSPKACGDVNDDGNINPVDATLILQNSAGLLGTLPNAPSADVNDDGTVNAVDATLILQHSAALIPASGLHCP